MNIVDQEYIDRIALENLNDTLTWASKIPPEYMGWTYLKFSSMKIRDPQCAPKIMPWCEKEFGENYGYLDRVFYFRHAKDATMFILKWLL